MRKKWRLVSTLVLLVVLAGVSGLQRRAAYSGPDAGPTTVAVARTVSWPASDAEVEALVRQVVSQAGGLETIISPGDVVVVKPNLVLGAAPEEGHTTDPRVTRAVVTLAREAGAAEVIIAEGSAAYRDGSDARGATWEAFHRCGYDVDWDRVDDVTGAPLVDLNDAGGIDQHDPALVAEVTIPNGLIWSTYWLPRTVLEADVFIGVPVLKNHYAAGVTLALKNLIGIAPSDIYHSPGSQMYKGALGHGPDDLGRHIVDLNLARPLDFVVLDGLRGMTDGPNGGTLADPPMRLLVAGADPVAVDTIGTLAMGYDPSTVPYLAWAAGAGLGTRDVAQITVLGLPVSQVRRDFPAPYGNPPAQRAEAVPPAVELIVPGEGAVVTEYPTIEASASDDRQVAKVEFYAGAELQAVVSEAPYQAQLDLSPYQGQMVSLQAVAYDEALNDAADVADVTVVRAPAPGTASVQTATIDISTYPYADFLISDVDPEYNMAYRYLDRAAYQASGPMPALESYRLLVLENDYLRVTVLPELGGRVYQMIFKPTGHNELYQNPVIKPTPWGPFLLHPERNWWLAAGGIEWCLPVEEHGYEWGRPWSYTVVTSTAGVTVTLRDTDPGVTDRLRATIDLFLPADRAYLQVAPHLENPTAAVIDFKYWTNAMLAPGAANTVGPDLGFVFNADQMTVHSTGDPDLPAAGSLMDWPVHGGRDYSRLGNWDEWLGFFEYPQAAADFFGVYDTAADEGVARIFPSDVAQGAKGFAFGWSNPIDWRNWTDDGSTYVELHGGLAPTFSDEARLEPASEVSWSELWVPVTAIGDLSAATAEAALGIRLVGWRFEIGLQPTMVRPAGGTLTLRDRETCAKLARWHLPSVAPDEPFRASLPAGGWDLDDISLVYLDREGDLLAAVNPTDCIPPSAWVEPLPNWAGSETFTVSWSGEDVWTGVTSYDVQVRDGYEGTWTDWRTDFSGISDTFTGLHGHTYFFRARARDLAGNLGRYGDPEWGDAFTTVLREPAPVLVTSRKEAVSQIFWSHQQTVSYTVTISNTGNATASAVVTDTPPVEMIVLTDTLGASAGPVPTFVDDTIRWMGDVPAGDTMRLTYAVSPTEAISIGQSLTNTVEIVGSVLGPIVRQETVMRVAVTWMPIIAR
jgi:uncharacterized repeat protein (TIGR01451 family)